MKLVRLLFLLLLSVGVLQTISCSNNTSMQSTPVITNPIDTAKVDSARRDSLTKSLFGALSVNVHWGTTAYPPILQLTIDSAGSPLSVLPGDSVWYLSVGQERGVPRYDTTWSGILQEVVETGEYVFTVQRVHGIDTLRATFTLPVPVFHITAPSDGATVRRFNHTNDTIVYSPGGGRDVTVVFRSNNTGNIKISGYSEPDNGEYAIMEDGDTDCEAWLVRHLTGNLSMPTPFKSVNYDYYESSNELRLHF